MYAQYHSYTPSGSYIPPPFLFNKTLDKNQSNEAFLYNSIAMEWQHLHGCDIVWLPREVRQQEQIFGEFLASKFTNGFKIRMFIEENEAWGGQGDIYSKFGLQVTDECTLHTNKDTFFNSTASGYPKQGDIVYIEKTKKLFEVSHVEDETNPSFYLFGNLTGFKISCKLFTYNHEEINQDSIDIPDAIKALDNLILNNDNELVTVEEKDFENLNLPIQKITSSILDVSEKDALG